MTSWSSVEEALRERRVSDVLVPGWVDRDGDIPEFRPQPVVAFMRLDESVLRLESVGQYDQLAVSVESSIRLADVQLFADAEDEMILASHGEKLYGDSWSELRCTDVRYFTDSRSSVAEGVVKCLSLELEGRYTLFFDPTWTFGIRVGNGEDLARWKNEYVTADSGISEHSWK